MKQTVAWGCGLCVATCLYTQAEPKSLISRAKVSAWLIDSAASIQTSIDISSLIYLSSDLYIIFFKIFPLNKYNTIYYDVISRGLCQLSWLAFTELQDSSFRFKCLREFLSRTIKLSVRLHIHLSFTIVLSSMSEYIMDVMNIFYCSFFSRSSHFLWIVWDYLAIKTEWSTDISVVYIA